LLPLVVSAQAQPNQSTHTNGYQIELPAKPYRMYPGDYDNYKGIYDLSNGETMILRAVGRRLYADVGKRPRTEMIPAAPNVFVAVDRQLKLTLDEGVYGQVTGELIMVMPRKPGQSADAGGEVVRMVVNR
jgi:hypothetical protein